MILENMVEEKYCQFQDNSVQWDNEWQVFGSDNSTQKDKIQFPRECCFLCELIVQVKMKN